MATIDLEVKYSNRQLPRIIVLEHDDFDTVKDAVRATAGARFDSATRRWKVTCLACKALTEMFTTRRRDFYVTMDNAVMFTATGETVWSPPRMVNGLPTDARDFADKARAVRDGLQAAYDISDEALAAEIEKL